MTFAIIRRMYMLSRHLFLAGIADDTYDMAKNERPPFALTVSTTAHTVIEARATLSAEEPAVLSILEVYHPVEVVDHALLHAPRDILLLAAASFRFIELSRANGIEPNIGKVHTYQKASASGTPFDLEPWLHLFPKPPAGSKPRPPAGFTRDGFKVAGCWVGAPHAALKHVSSIINDLDAPLARLLDKRFGVSIQIKWQTYRMVYRAQAKLMHLMRQQVPSDIHAAMALASAQQHRTLRVLFLIPVDQLPDDFTTACRHPSATVYSIHLGSGFGASIPNPLIIYRIAHLGGTISTLPVIALHPLVKDLVADPLTFKTSRVRHLSEAVPIFEQITGSPAFFEDPPYYPELHSTFRAKLLGEGTSASITNIAAVARDKPQSCLNKIADRQLVNDLTASTDFPDETRTRINLGRAFNTTKFLFALTISRANALNSEQCRTGFNILTGNYHPFIGLRTTCLQACKVYGPGKAPKNIPGAFGRYHVSVAWHRSGYHQVSCRVGKMLNYRHNKLNLLLAEELKLAGAAVDPSETPISQTDGKRADLCLWHPFISLRGIACDTTVWNDFTHPRLPLSASIPGYTLQAAEAYKSNKYRALCDTVGLDFRPLALNILGGFGMILYELHRLVWDHRKAEARRHGFCTRKVEAQERRALEKISAEMIRCLHRAIYNNLHGRTHSTFTPPPPDETDDGDAQQA
jgi:hypothetical protein